MKLLKLHIGLYRYFRMEFPKKKTKAERIDFIKNLVKAYLKELLNMYKSLYLILDPTYQKQKKEFKKYQNIKVDLQRCIKILKYMDEKLEKSGINRQRRRQFWRDFYSRGEIRKETFDQLLNEIERIR